MADEQKTLSGQINNLATRVAQEIKTLKGQAVNTSTFVPKVGDRGALAGYERFTEEHADGGTHDFNIYANSPDVINCPSTLGSVVFNVFGNSVWDATNNSVTALDYKTSWIKIFKIQYGDSLQFPSDAVLLNMTDRMPDADAGDTYVFFWNGDKLFINQIKAAE